MAEETQYTLVSGQVSLTTANGNLDGTGTLATVITGSSNGTLVKTVTIIARNNTSNGMVRLFVYNGSNVTTLIAEIEVPAVTRSSRDIGFNVIVPLELQLKSGYVLMASTQNADNFAVIAEGLDWTYYATSVRSDTTQYTANTGIVTISTANPNTNGTGTVGTALTAGSSATYKGTKINSFTVKAVGNTTPGIVRFFVINSALTKASLIKEIAIPYCTPTSALESFSETAYFGEEGYCIQSSYLIYVSTENAESFVVTVDAEDWNYVA